VVTECLVEGLWHLAVVTCVVVKFGTARRGCTVVNCGGNCRSGKGSRAYYPFILKIVVLVTNDFTDLS